MTKRERQTRIRAIERELLERMRRDYPLVELAGTEQTPSGAAVIDVYVPYPDKVAVLRTVVDRVVELNCDDNFPVQVIPVSHKPRTKRRAA